MKRHPKRWGRILFNSLTAISLLLALATAGLWGRSYWVDDLFVWYRSDGVTVTHRRIGLACGGVTIYWADRKNRGSHGRPPFTHSPLDARRTNDIDWDWNRETRKRLFAFSWERTNFWTNPGMVPGGNRLIRFPIWAPLLLLLILPTLRVAAFLLHLRRTNSGFCPSCGYDVRANPSRCSECGRDIAAEPSPEYPPA